MALKAYRPRLKTINTSRLAAPKKRGAKFYDEPEWRALVRQLIAERGRRCEHCGATDCRLWADHVIELKDGGAEMDPNNLQLLCARCHGVKTAAARIDRLKS